jgi:hypothetical protein
LGAGIIVKKNKFNFKPHKVKINSKICTTQLLERSIFEKSQTEKPQVSRNRRKTVTTESTDFAIIETDRHIYTPEYIELTKDFYLKM